MWEFERYDWSQLRASRTARDVPSAINALLGASNEEDADRAYWKIDNVVVVQGSLFEAAIPTTACLLVGLVQCNEIARPRVLELLVQLTAGEDSPEEVKLGRQGIAEECARMLRLAAGTFLSLLEYGTEEEQGYCIDLLGLCARQDVTLRAQIRFYFKRFLDRAPPRGLSQLVESWMNEI
jgi:hypothetical protein